MTTPKAVVDTLNSLLEAELNSVFRFMGEGSPYLDRAAVEIRQPLIDMIHATERFAGTLFGLIESLGGVPVPRSLRPEEQYLAFLSLKFLLPKLAEAEQLTIRRYENALGSLGGADAQVTDVLARLLADHRSQLVVLEQTAAKVAGRQGDTFP